MTAPGRRSDGVQHPTTGPPIAYAELVRTV
jgi:hypothetical protein